MQKKSDYKGKKRLQRISELYKYCKDHCFFQSYPSGIIISKDIIENELTELFEKADYFFFRTNYKCDSEWLYIRPKGKYAIIEHEGTYESLPVSYEKLKNKQQIFSAHKNPGRLEGREQIMKYCKIKLVLCGYQRILFLT